ncbi:amidohydrolase family protein [Gaiella sp.]|uniref:N-acyl-D-amino-acid deacylase family protein n=1 Tax=Gaiella sp. TaxID=2663207 RepID=UPI003266C442
MLDLLITGATVYPGDARPFTGAVGVTGSAIDLVTICHEDRSLPPAQNVVDGRGLLLCPGFIDMHTHSGLVSFDDPFLTPKLAQGFTTEVINPDGLAPAPVSPERWRERRAYLRPLEGAGPERWTWETVAEYLDALDATRPALSLVPSIGHGAVRDLILGGGRVSPTTKQLREMRREVRAGLEAGCRMLSFGLVYLPGAYADTEELVAMAEEAAAFDAPLVPHVRNEGHGLLEAISELIDVARRTGAPLHLSHLKSLADETLIEPLLELLEETATEIDLTFDQYPYGAGSTLLASVLPGWAQEGGASGTLQALGSGTERRRIAHDIAHGLPGWENILDTLGPERIEIAHAAAPNEGTVGRTLGEIALDRGCDAVTAALDLIGESALDVTMVLHYATDAAVRTIAQHPLMLVGSDGIFGTRPHPRVYGTAPRFLGRFAIREGLLPVDEAVARLTARAADRLRLTDRGRIEPGKRADLVLLDPALYVDNATYADPCRSPEGVAGVWVAGRSAWHDGAPTGARHGGVIR